MSTVAQTKRGGIEELIADIVRAFVFRPEHVAVASSDGGNVTILTLSVHGEDYGTVVGKMGRKIQALRTIAQLLGAEEKRDYRLILPERDKRDDFFQAPFMPDAGWRPDATMALLRRVLDRMLSKPFEVAVIAAGGQTHFEVAPDQSERNWLEQVQPYIHTVFHAIGKSQGHELYVEVQPAVAAGAK